MNNNKMQNMNVIVGSILAEMRTRSGLSISDVVLKTANQRLSILGKIESGQSSIKCCDLYQLLKIYSPTKEQIYFFCTIPMKGFNLGTN